MADITSTTFGDQTTRGWIEVTVAMDRTLRAFVAAARSALVRNGLENMGPANLLFLLSIGSEPENLRDVLHKGRHLASNASYAIKALHEAGLVDRYADPKDRRSAVVCLSPRGAALVSDIVRTLPSLSDIQARQVVELVRRLDDALGSQGDK